jgi:hypothetical protein
VQLSLKESNSVDEKDGKTLWFIEVKMKSKSYVIERSFSDFEWLVNVLVFKI